MPQTVLIAQTAQVNAQLSVYPALLYQQKRRLCEAQPSLHL
ncbi:hypothetical protein HMPREF1493_1083 [Atopobium sp. ICM42b]|nr:hypothetical protein HMPREF1493_1083 [Atopobium sp. ICM42b]